VTVVLVVLALGTHIMQKIVLMLQRVHLLQAEQHTRATHSSLTLPTAMNPPRYAVELLSLVSLAIQAATAYWCLLTGCRCLGALRQEV